MSGSGERYDFVLNASGSENNYWIRAKAIGSCENRTIEQYAILTYLPESEISTQDLSRLYLPVATPPRLLSLGRIMNFPNAICYRPGDDFVCSADLQSYDVTTLPKADQRFVLNFDSYTVNNEFVYSYLGNYQSK